MSQRTYADRVILRRQPKDLFFAMASKDEILRFAHDDIANTHRGDNHSGVNCFSDF